MLQIAASEYNKSGRAVCLLTCRYVEQICNYICSFQTLHMENRIDRIVGQIINSYSSLQILLNFNQFRPTRTSSGTNYLLIQTILYYLKPYKN